MMFFLIILLQAFSLVWSCRGSPSRVNRTTVAERESKRWRHRRLRFRSASWEAPLAALRLIESSEPSGIELSGGSRSSTRPRTALRRCITVTHFRSGFELLEETGFSFWQSHESGRRPPWTLQEST